MPQRCITRTLAVLLSKACALTDRTAGRRSSQAASVSAASLAKPLPCCSAATEYVAAVAWKAAQTANQAGPLLERNHVAMPADRLRLRLQLSRNMPPDRLVP